MKASLLLLSAFICFTISGQTQTDLMNKQSDSYVKADKELNSVYQKILAEYKLDTAFIKNLKQAQRIWVEFRDAEVRMKFPEREPGYYGSSRPLCIGAYLEKLTIDRTNTLKQWLNGAEEGDVCCGSIKIKK